MKLIIQIFCGRCKSHFKNVWSFYYQQAFKGLSLTFRDTHKEIKNYLTQYDFQLPFRMLEQIIILSSFNQIRQDSGVDPEILKKRGATCHHGWPTIKLETISFWPNIYISVFKFSPYLYTMKACQWNLINFSKFLNTFIKQEKNTLMQQSMRYWKEILGTANS